MKILCVIPSRLGSTRLARKPLLMIQGKPMIQRVYERALQCKLLTKVVVATDSSEIANVIASINGNIEITDSHIATGSDRVAAVAQRYPDMDIIINLQGDEPFIKPKMLEQLVAPYFDDASVQMTTLAFPLDMSRDYHNPNIVKVITDLHNNAIYFSRAPIPHFRSNLTEGLPVFHHMGLYAFTREFLLTYTALPQTKLEKLELLEQLRVLEYGYNIKVCITEERTLEINTPEELAMAQTFELD